MQRTNAYMYNNRSSNANQLVRDENHRLRALPEQVKRLERLILTGSDNSFIQANWHKREDHPSWYTLHRAPNEQTLQRGIDGQNLIGVRWKEDAPWITIDIDTGSRYHRKKQLAILRKHLSDIGLNSIWCQSSFSKGWHIICPLSKSEPIEELQSVINWYLRSKNYVIQDGTLEIYPSNKHVRMPCQFNFGWKHLDDPSDSHNKKKADRLAWFNRQVIALAADWDGVKRSVYADHLRLESPMNFERYRCSTKLLVDRAAMKLRALTYMKNGLTEFGQLHDAIVCLNALAWDGDIAAGVFRMARDSERMAKFTYGVLSTKHNGKSRTINRYGVNRLWKLVVSAATYRPGVIGSSSYQEPMGFPRVRPEDWICRKHNERVAREAFSDIIDFVLTHRQENGVEATFTQIVKNTGRAQSTVAKYLKKIREEENEGVVFKHSGRVAVDGYRGSASVGAGDILECDNSVELSRDRHQASSVCQDTEPNMLDLSSLIGVSKNREVDALLGELPSLQSVAPRDVAVRQYDFSSTSEKSKARLSVGGEQGVAQDRRAVSASVILELRRYNCEGIWTRDWNCHKQEGKQMTFAPLTEQQAHKLCDKYPDGLELWDQFWQFMSKQLEAGASIEYHMLSQKMLEGIWKSRGGEYAWEKQNEEPATLAKIGERISQSIANTPLEFVPEPRKISEPVIFPIQEVGIVEPINESVTKVISPIAEHMIHLKKRQTDKSYWADDCEACQLHRDANSRVKPWPIINHNKAERAWERLETR